MRKKVALIFGGRSLEREISIITAMQVLNALVGTIYIVEPVYMSGGAFYMGNVDDIKHFVKFDEKEHKKVFLKEGAFFECRHGKVKEVFKPDVALLCCHGGEGENGVLQALLQFNDIPYTSCGVLESGICMDKAISKMLFESIGLDVLPCVVVKRREWTKNKEDVLQKIHTLDFPFIVKPATMGSSIGISVAKDEQSLVDAMDFAFEFDDKIIVERLLEGCVEVNCAAMRKNGEIIISETENPTSNGEYLSFEDKYIGGKMSSGEHIIPADIGNLNDVVKKHTRTLYDALFLDGIVRIDYLCDIEKGKVYVNEINAIPGSMAFYLFKEVQFRELMLMLVDEALRKSEGKTEVDKFNTGVLEMYKQCGKLGGKVIGQ